MGALKLIFISVTLFAFAQSTFGQGTIIEYRNDTLLINGVFVSGKATKAFLDSIVGQKSKTFTDKSPALIHGEKENLITTYHYKELGFNFLIFSNFPGVLVLDVSIHKNDNTKEDRSKLFYTTFKGKFYLQGVLMSDIKTHGDLSKVPCSYNLTYLTFGNSKDLLGGELACGRSLIRLSYDSQENLTSVRIFHDKRENVQDH